MIDWIIDPMRGCGPLRFGSRRTEVGRQLGAPADERQFSVRDYREYRGQGPRNYDFIAEYDNDILISVTFPYQKNKLSVSGIDVLSQPPQSVVDALKTINGGTIDVYGEAFCFSTLGIILNDWSGDDVSDRWVGVMSREGYAKFMGGQPPDAVLT